jgi:hypothetical protein
VPRASAASEADLCAEAGAEVEPLVVAALLRAEAALAAVAGLPAEVPLPSAPLPASRELARVLLRIDWLSAMFPYPRPRLAVKLGFHWASAGALLSSHKVAMMQARRTGMPAF